MYENAGKNKSGQQKELSEHYQGPMTFRRNEYNTIISIPFLAKKRSNRILAGERNLTKNGENNDRGTRYSATFDRIRRARSSGDCAFSTGAAYGKMIKVHSELSDITGQ